MKVGIVVPFSWSFWGAVLEHAELQAEALRARGLDVRIIIGNDPPGTFTRALHPRHGRHGEPPPDVIPIGRTVIVPANGSLPNICLSPRVPFKLKRVLARERFDVLHLHEPMTPAVCVATLALAKCALVATWHAAGELRLDALRPAVVGLPARPDRPLHRGLRPGEDLRRALDAVRLRGDPERRPDPAGGRPREPRELDRLHRPARPAQGDAGAAARVAGHPPAHRGAAAARRAPTRSPSSSCSRATGSRARGSTCSASSRRRS